MGKRYRLFRIFIFFSLNFGFHYIIYRLFACHFSFKLTLAPALHRHRQVALLSPFLAEQHEPSTASTTLRQTSIHTKFVFILVYIVSLLV